MNILVTGGCGYKGSVLVPKLLARGDSVTALDTQWFGNFLPANDRLTVIKGDVRHLDDLDLKQFDAVIHLAAIANDPCGDLDPLLTWEISALSTMQLADKAARAGVKRFIFASTASVYGIKEEEQITEDLTLLPISVYNKTKMLSERVMLSYSDDMVVQILRPATVCGLSPRMRLDVAVNLLTMQALTKKRITVLGGGQYRPNIHIQDLTDLYCFLLDNPQITGIYNAGFENLTISDMASRIASKTGAEVIVEPSNDPRSYRLNSDKLLATGFKPNYGVDYAIDEIIEAYNSKKLVDDEALYNVAWMRRAVIGPVKARA